MDFQTYFQSGHGWLFLPVAVVLGALHGLEPGHSKTMMAAFIISIRGTVRQAVLLGLAATISHTAVIWLLALVGLHYAGKFKLEAVEPWLQVATGVIVVGTAAWMLRRLQVEARSRPSRHHEDSEAIHQHAHSHGPGHAHTHSHGPGHAEADTTVAESHALLEDAHARAHAEDLERRFAGREVTTGQIALFGLTGGLSPCASAFAVLLLCLQAREFTLGFSLVLAFSLGLALTLVGVGVAAALSVRHATRRFAWLDRAAHRMPWVSAAVLVVLGLFLAIRGFLHIVRA